MGRVLVVDDEASISWSLERIIREEGHEVQIASSVEEVFTWAPSPRFDALMVDIRLPGQDGLSALPELRRRLGEKIPVVVMTAFGSLQTAVHAVGAGAFEYLTKPFDLEDVVRVVNRALERNPSRNDLVTQPPKISEQLLGCSPAMQKIFREIALVAGSDVPVLLTGESGVGKEEVALALHRHSRRQAGPFVPVCLGAINPSVMESELFGHVRGAFTGADQRRAGLLELASEGTVFLDEIGDVPVEQQVKLLRAIERKEVTPVGDPLPRTIDFRVIAATHRSLREMVEAGTFREDLMYRLSVVHIHIPPLRERREDIPLLAQAFLQRLSTGTPVTSISSEGMNELMCRDWPGNVRELRNAIERAAIVARGEPIRSEHLPPPTSKRDTQKSELETVPQLQRLIQHWAETELQNMTTEGGNESGLYDRLLQMVEAPLFQTLMEHTGGNLARAAQILGIHRSTLRQRLRRDD